jgi:serine/threonine-protein kinase
MIQTSTRTGGVRFGKYVLLDRLAVGGMAEIFLARQEGMEGFEKTVVIKRIRPHLSKQKSFVDMFLDEARLAAQLTHPNIVQIHELGQVGDSYFIAMEYVFGRDMARIIPKAERMGIAFPHVYALKIASEVCEGLYYAHQRTDAWGNPLHIVHRDVTPENVFVSFDGAVKILDFGIAKARGQTGQTTVGEIKGKASYMSPEQALGMPLDCRSDIFSLGVVLYEWLTGFRLFTGDSEVAVLRSVSEGKIYGPSYFKPDIPPAVEEVVMRALEKDREKRYPTAWDMQRDLDRVLGESEFRPSSIHLANFLKQLFSDELEAERARLTRAAETLDGEPHRPSRLLRLHLEDADRQALEGVAERHGLTVEELARDVLHSWLKYR